MPTFAKDSLTIGRLKRKSSIVETDLGDELVLLDPDSQVLYLLDELGAYVWTHLPDLGLSNTLNLVVDELGLSKSEALKGIDSYVVDLLLNGFFYQFRPARLPDFLHSYYDASKN